MITPLACRPGAPSKKKLIVSLIEIISGVRALMDINGTFDGRNISNITAKASANSLGHIQLIGQEVIFNRLSSLATIRFLIGQAIIQCIVTIAAWM